MKVGQHVALNSASEMPTWLRLDTMVCTRVEASSLRAFNPGEWSVDVDVNGVQVKEEEKEYNISSSGKEGKGNCKPSTDLTIYILTAA
jgi:hypothetical protein